MGSLVKNSLQDLTRSAVLFDVMASTRDSPRGRAARVPAWNEGAGVDRINRYTRLPHGAALYRGVIFETHPRVESLQFRAQFQGVSSGKSAVSRHCRIIEQRHRHQSVCLPRKQKGLSIVPTWLSISCTRISPLCYLILSLPSKKRPNRSNLS